LPIAAIIETVASTDTPAKAGLEDIVVATSSICYLDGERGVLAYRGHDIHDLAQHATFEEVCCLLWQGLLPADRNWERCSRSSPHRAAFRKACCV